MSILQAENDVVLLIIIFYDYIDARHTKLTLQLTLESKQVVSGVALPYTATCNTQDSSNFMNKQDSLDFIFNGL
jgi:hypothetical protein